MKRHALVLFDLRQLHGRLQPGPVLQPVHLAEQLLDVAQRGQLDVLAVEKAEVLVQHAHVVDAPGQQGVVRPAPADELLQRFPEVRRAGQGLRVQPGHPPDPRMDAQVMRRGDRDGNAVARFQVRPELYGADLDHFEDQLVPHLPVGRALVGDRLVPFKVDNNIGHLVGFLSLLPAGRRSRKGSGGPGNLQVITARMGVHVDHFPGEVQVGPAF